MLLSKSLIAATIGASLMSNSKTTHSKQGKGVKGRKLLASLQKKASEPKGVIWDSCCRIIDDDPIPSEEYPSKA